MEAREMEPNYVNSRIGEKIKDLRNKNGLTQQELADRAELTKGCLLYTSHRLPQGKHRLKRYGHEISASLSGRNLWAYQ